MINSTLSRYFGLQFLGAVVAVFAGIFALVALVDFIELLRRSNGAANATALLVAQASIFRVPQVTERIMPFAILIGAMACYLSLSRRLELVSRARRRNVRLAVRGAGPHRGVSSASVLWRRPSTIRSRLCSRNARNVSRSRCSAAAAAARR